MANTPKKMKDPTEAALSAIQDALQVRDDDKAPETAAAPAEPSYGPQEPAAEAPWPGLRSDPADTTNLFDDDRPLEETPTSRRPANDDRESIGGILRALQGRPARTSYILASVFAGVWVLAGFALGWLYIPPLQAALGPTGLTAPMLAVLGAIYLAPVVFFYVLAHMAGARRKCG